MTHLPRSIQCAVCKESVTDTYRIDLRGRPFHAHHAVCDTCLRPVQRTAAGLCRSCHRSVVSTQAGAIRITETVADALRRHFGLDIPQHVPVMLTDRIDSDKGVLGQASLTETRYSDGRRLTSSAIHLQRGLPAVQLAAVAAHELAHVWLWSHDRRPAKVVDEGIAELCAYWTLGRLGGSTAAVLQHRISTNPDPVYGDGYRQARCAEQRHGWRAVRIHLIAHGRLP